MEQGEKGKTRNGKTMGEEKDMRENKQEEKDYGGARGRIRITWCTGERRGRIEVKEMRRMRRSGRSKQGGYPGHQRKLRLRNIFFSICLTATGAPSASPGKARRTNRGGLRRKI